ncbi:MAG: hypothetical protein U1E51_25155, partial [Candidatus Binatia bacterium]|nr:hypothetical protein [Candidatus Binatia bacterium]
APLLLQEQLDIRRVFANEMGRKIDGHFALSKIVETDFRRACPSKRGTSSLFTGPARAAVLSRRHPAYQGSRNVNRGPFAGPAKFYRNISISCSYTNVKFE